MENNIFTIRQKLNLIESQLKLESSSFEPMWKDLSEFILPRRGRFFVDDVNNGENKNRSIIDSTASLACRTLASGMMTGVTSPARDWFRLTTDNSNLNENSSVRLYLDDVASRMRATFLRSNLYNVLPTLYGDLGAFGTGCVYMEEDVKDSVVFTSFPIGSYRISNDMKGNVIIFFREFQMTVRQIVEKFGKINPNNPTSIDWSNISDTVKTLWMAGNTEFQINVKHMILPNDDYNPNKMESKFKKFKSCYYENGGSNSSSLNLYNYDRMLSEKGYDYFPVMAVRWELAGEDTYGTNAPGMVALGDVKQLQFHEKRIAQAIDQKVKPSMVGPTSLKNVKTSILPGEITYMDEREGQARFRRLFEIDFDIRELEGKQEQLRSRISKSFYEDLFLMLSRSNRRQITATEIEERQEEKLLALGPVLERVNQDLLNPLIENTFIIMQKQGMLPPAPDELQGQEYKIEYVSIMAQAQKLAGISYIERLVGFVGQAAQLDPTIVEKLNIEEVIESYANQLGTPPKLLRTKEELEKIKQAQAQAQEQQAQIQNGIQVSKAARDLSQTNISDNSALTQLLGV